MKMTVCEFPDEARRKDAAWTDLVHYLQMSPADVVVLPEMPFCDWKMFLTRTVDPAVWREALAIHDAMVARFAELQEAMVLTSRPVATQGKRLNEAFCWTREGGYRGTHVTARRSPVVAGVSPEGEILAETSADAPFLTVEIALAEADRAKHTYPRNLPVYGRTGVRHGIA